MKITQVALLGAATLAAAQPHNHAHLHARHGSHLQARDGDAAVTVTAPGPTVTLFELDGQILPDSEVEAGLANGKYVIIGESIAAATPTPAAPVSAAEFFEKPSSSSSSTSTTPSSTPSSTPVATSTSSSVYVAPTTSSTAAAYVAPAPSSSAPAAATPATSSGGGVDADFPSGTIPCSTFPSAYGAVAADWLGLGGWTGIQNVPDYSLTDAVISYIETAISGSTCTKNSFCSYACPAGYQKSQWPAAQGNTGQSLGGIYCNPDGMLELSRPGVSQLCTAGVGNLEVTNNLGTNVAICRTDYPGTESETVALNTLAGQTYPLTCPDSSDYFTWKDLATTAQYYINPSGVSVDKACTWGESGSNTGNWAPVNIGAGKSTTGETFISIFPNKPTNPDGVLDFNIAITGGVSGVCSYKGGKFYTNGVESDTGCTASVTGTATFVFSN